MARIYHVMMGYSPIHLERKTILSLPKTLDVQGRPNKYSCQDRIDPFTWGLVKFWVKLIMEGSV